MDNNDLKSIEEALGIQLPETYILIALSNQLREPLHSDKGAVIAINKAFRNGDFGDEKWNPDLFAFGHDGAGNYYCIDSSAASSKIYLRDHETLDILDTGIGLQEFVLRKSEDA